MMRLSLKNTHQHLGSLLELMMRKDSQITQDGFAHSALWSKPQAPFVCIEHWSGHADTPDAPTELSEKPTLTHLKDGHMQYTTAMRFA